MDLREDEQKRGISMESSAVSLLFSSSPEEKYLINLIDSPGHVDFSSEVSTAVRLCDGALVVVDVVEGMCIQTAAVLRQAWEERLRPCLVLNKMDRLVKELQLTPDEAYEHLSRIIEQVNAVLSGLITAEAMGASVSGMPAPGSASASATGSDSGAGDSNFHIDESSEQALLFHPSRGNVLFASAVDRWAFRVSDFATILGPLLDGALTKRELVRALWGNYAWNPKTKRVIVPNATHPSTMFAQFVLRNVWEMYSVIVLEPKPKRLLKMVSTLGLDLKYRELTREPDTVLETVMHAWLPLSTALLSMVVRCVPDPRASQEKRVAVLWPHDAPADTEPVRAAIAACDTSEAAPLVVFVSKMLAVPRSLLKNAAAAHPLPGDTSGEGGGSVQDQDDTEFVAFARVFSGVVRPGEPVFVLGPKYKPHAALADKHVTHLPHGVQPMMIMGYDFSPLERVQAGNVLALRGLGEHILKTATVSQTRECCSLTRMPTQSAPILRVSVEPANPKDWALLAKGLRMLNRADPVVEVLVQHSGEHILCAIGELHLERCLKDLRERFAKIELRVSAPIAAFKETLVWAAGAPPAVGAAGPASESVYLSSDAGSAAPALPTLASSASGVAIPGTFADERWEGLSRVASSTPLSQSGAAETGSSTASGRGGAVDNGHGGDDGGVEVADGSEDQGGGATRNPLQGNLQALVGVGGQVMAKTADGKVRIVVHAVPLPESVTRALELVGMKYRTSALGASQSSDRGGDDERGPAAAVSAAQSNSDDEDEESAADSSGATGSTDAAVHAAVRGAFAQAAGPWKSEVDSVWSLGPHGLGPNILLNHIQLSGEPVAGLARVRRFRKAGDGVDSDDDAALSVLLNDVSTGIVSGFQLATRAGPMCEEPMWGVAFVVDAVYVAPEISSGTAEAKLHGFLSGQVMSAMRDACRRAFNVHGEGRHNKADGPAGTPTAFPSGIEARLVEAYFRCALQCSVEQRDGDQLGKMHSVLSKRRGRVVREDLIEGTSIFTIEALLPVAEAFGIADDLRKRTSGAVSAPQLVFSHWEVLDVDPYHRFTTDEELEEFGETVEHDKANNLARRYVLAVRKRKGLQVEEKLVVAAEKQRTLGRGK